MKDKKLFITIVSIFTVISFMIGVSYAYFTVQLIGNDTASTQNIKTGTLKINYNGTDTLDMNNTQPPDTKSMTFTVTNSGTLPVNGYQVYFSKVVNEILYDEMVYTLTCTSSDTNPCLGKEETPLPKTTGSALTQSNIAPGTTHSYTLSVTFKDTGTEQDYNQNKQVSFKITINEQFEYQTLIASSGYASNYSFWMYAESITSITFEDEIDVPANAFKSWDVSVAGEGGIMAYIIDDGLGANTYELYIQTNDGIILANSNSSYLFTRFHKLTSINNISMFKTNTVTNMQGMFTNCYALISLDLSLFDTSNVTNMSYMFIHCGSLTSLDLSTFDTSNVTNMQGMFQYCDDLISLDVGSFDTSNVTNARSIFSTCRSLTSLDISNFDVSGVTDMTYMFAYCNDLISLDLSNFDTSNVTNMTMMFRACTALTSLDLSSFDTSNVTTMLEMFLGCESLSSLNVSSFNTAKVTTMSTMFAVCTNLTSLDLSSFDTSNVTTMYGMFNECNSLSSLNISSFNTVKVTTMWGMFAFCGDLTSLDLSSFDTSSVTDMMGMFYECSSLTNLYLNSANFSSVTSYSMMFVNITNGINIVVKDATAQTWITSRLSDEGKTGNVTIYVP